MNSELPQLTNSRIAFMTLFEYPKRRGLSSMSAALRATLLRET